MGGRRECRVRRRRCQLRPRRNCCFRDGEIQYFFFGIHIASVEEGGLGLVKGRGDPT